MNIVRSAWPATISVMSIIPLLVVTRKAFSFFVFSTNAMLMISSA
uniref:Uncharacterized protein n=1 Tax=Salmonella phage vB_SEnST11_KE24 TaxID=3161175 RepID=A0AAU8GFQ9_9CAUD